MGDSLSYLDNLLVISITSLKKAVIITVAPRQFFLV